MDLLPYREEYFKSKTQSGIEPLLSFCFVFHTVLGMEGDIRIIFHMDS